MFSKQQIAFLKSINIEINFDQPSDDSLALIEDEVSAVLQTEGFDKNDRITETGKLCESILDLLE